MHGNKFSVTPIFAGLFCRCLQTWKVWNFSACFLFFLFFFGSIRKGWIILKPKNANHETLVINWNERKEAQYPITKWWSERKGEKRREEEHTNPFVQCLDEQTLTQTSQTDFICAQFSLCITHAVHTVGVRTYPSEVSDFALVNATDRFAFSFSNLEISPSNSRTVSCTKCNASMNSM